MAGPIEPSAVRARTAMALARIANRAGVQLDPEKPDVELLEQLAAELETRAMTPEQLLEQVAPSVYKVFDAHGYAAHPATYHLGHDDEGGRVLHLTFEAWKRIGE